MPDKEVVQKGVTPPISVSLPTPEELAANEALIEELKRENNFEAPEETERRRKTLHSIQKVTWQFVKESLAKKGRFSKAYIEAGGGKIFTYGSYRLGVFGPGSDIDTLIVAPREVTREDFFELFPSILQRMSQKDAITELTPVPDAFVPIIKLEFNKISIDLIFASVQQSSVPMDLSLKDNNILRGLDDRYLRSVNGTRVTDEILELVPQQKTFRTALRAVKLWAQRRAIYANVIGFPGGVAWAMLVARVCQLYPQATGSVIVGKFFRIIARWAWPQPVILKNIESGPLQVRVWNPEVYKGDRFHLMPIITPAYPSMCATHNITMSTKKIILQELNRGGDICDTIFTGKRQWKDLFARHTFFTNGYKYYLSVVSASRSKEAQLLWSGLVESKVRHLVSELDYDENIAIAQPFNKGFDRVHRCKNEDEVQAVANGDLQYQAKDIKTETTDSTNNPMHNAAASGDADKMALADDAVKDEKNGLEVMTIHTTTYYIGLQLSPQAKKLDISTATTRFRDLCSQWPNYDGNINSVHVVNTRSFDLPDDVFQPGDTKPSRPKKKVVRNGSDQGSSTPKSATEVESKKRKLLNGEEDENSQGNAKRRQSVQEAAAATA